MGEEGTVLDKASLPQESTTRPLCSKVALLAQQHSFTDTWHTLPHRVEQHNAYSGSKLKKVCNTPYLGHDMTRKTIIQLQTQAELNHNAYRELIVNLERDTTGNQTLHVLAVVQTME